MAEQMLLHKALHLTDQKRGRPRKQTQEEEEEEEEEEEREEEGRQTRFHFGVSF